MALFDRFRIDGKRAMVTGASRGLGREMALALAEAGADMVLVARPSPELQETAADVRRLGRAATTFEADLSQPEMCEATCARVLAEAGPIDILVNNVGGRRVAVATQDMPVEQWRALVDLNLTSVFVCTKMIGGAMLARGAGGRIVNIASMNAMVVGRGGGGRHYEAAKAAVAQFTRATAVDWAAQGVTVNAICPGLFATAPNARWAREKPEMIQAILADIPVGRMGDPADLGPLVVYLASDAARYMTGATVTIDGGYTCL